MYNIFKRRASSPVPSTPRDLKTFRLTRPPPPLEPIQPTPPPPPPPSQFCDDTNDSTLSNNNDASINRYCVAQILNSQSLTSDSDSPLQLPQQQQQHNRQQTCPLSASPPPPLPPSDIGYTTATAASRSRPKSVRLGLFRKTGSPPVWYISARQRSSWPYGIKELHARGFALIHMWYDVDKANGVGRRLEEHWPLVFKWDGWKRLLTLNENCPPIEDDQVVQYINAATGRRGQWLSLSEDNLAAYEMPGKSLAKPHAVQRLDAPSLSLELRQLIKKTYDVPNDERQEQELSDRLETT
ncbi:hypothetical protein M8J76_004349 [Diaphorina citri]|nr:hypothetical protein M8J75_007117 [Diaphorina citri]KAI5722146.1 hypothetical protein M8J76_004349 [Diaphorina citri]